MDSTDQRTWDNYQTSPASRYTENFINNLPCSEAMKARIAADVRAYNPGVELPTVNLDPGPGEAGYNGEMWFFEQ